MRALVHRRLGSLHGIAVEISEVCDTFCVDGIAMLTISIHNPRAVRYWTE